MTLDPFAPSLLPEPVPKSWPYDEVLPPRSGLLVVLSGPSAAGKDAVLARLIDTGIALTRIVTATTRAARPGEIADRDYHFLTVDQFTAMRANDEFLEWAQVFGRDYYGTPTRDVRAALAMGEIVLLKIEVQGAAQIKRKVPDAVFIYLGPSSFDELVGRLKQRGTEDPDAFERRVKQAREELRQVPSYDYLVINRDGELDRAAKHVEAILAAERLRVRPRLIQLP